MTPESTEPTRPEAERVPREGAAWRAAAAISVLALAGALAVWCGHRFATSAVVDIGPTDGRYVRDFRDIERDGPVYFRWSSVPSSSLSLPVRFCGPGQVRLRVRRHFVDPALLSVSLSGVVIGQASIQAREDHPYDVVTFDVSKNTCDSDATVLLETSVTNDRPLGVALDWAEIRAPEGFRASRGTLVRGALVLGLTGLAFLLAGSGLPITFAFCGTLAALLAWAFSSQPIAAERALRGGLVALTLTLMLGVLIAGVAGLRRLPSRYRTALVAVTLFTIISRASFLDTRAFYPDYRVHALVQQTLNRNGLTGFLGQLFEIQYARSLGLQQIGGNWYPFPYPPGAYVLAGGVGRAFGLDPLDAVTVTAVTSASLIPTLTLAMGMALGLGPATGLVGAFYVAVHPLLVRRMALGYFPALAGQAIDALAALLVLTLLARRDQWLARGAWLTVALLAGFLVYTQSIANFGLLISGLLLIEVVRRSDGGRGAALRIAVAGFLALTAAAGIFYWRYLPVYENVANHRVQPESRVLDRLEQARRQAPDAAETPEADDLNDPYAGSTLNPFRGLARLASRLWRFTGPFVLLVGAGAWLIFRQSSPASQNLLLAWSGVAVWISLLAAGLPSPNGFQHLKDLEFVTPLAALAMGFGTVRLWRLRPVAGAAVALAWAVFCGIAFYEEWTGRLLVVAGL